MAPGEKSGEGSRNFRPQTGRLPGPSLRRLADLAKIWTCPSKNRPRPAPAPAIPFRAVRHSPGKARIALPEKMRPWRKKSLPRAGDACIPLSALNEAPHGKVAQLVRACGSYPQCREFKSPPCYQKATTPDVRKASGVFALWAFCVLGIRVPGLQPAPAQPCPPSALAGTPLFNVRCARRAGPSAREDRQSGRRLPPSQA